IVAHCCGDTDMTYLLGNGDGTFQAEVHFDGAPSPVAAAVADLNGDGKPDLLVAGGGAGATAGGVAILLNTSGGPPAVVAPAPITNVNAATRQPGPVAPESIVSALGANIVQTPASNDQTQPTESLGGVTVKVRDAAGVERPALLFSVASGQVNYL